MDIIKVDHGLGFNVPSTAPFVFYSPTVEHAKLLVQSSFELSLGL